MSKVLVTGGLGFIGSNLSLKLAGLGVNVDIVDNMSSSRPDFNEFFAHASNVSIIESCFASELIISKIKSGEYDYVFHLAAIPRVSYSVENPFETTDNNVNNTVRLIEACVGNIKRFIFSSSSSVYGGADILPTPVTHPKDPKSPYAWQKSCVEDFIGIMCNLNPEFDAICLRYFNVFGPGQFGGSAYATAVSAWCHAIKNNEQLRSDGTGEQSRDMCYIDNVVDANIKAMNCPTKCNGNRLNIACDDRVSNNQILEYLKDKFPGIQVRTAPFRAGDVMHTQADISESKKLIGYEPLVEFWDGLKMTLEWWGLNND